MITYLNNNHYTLIPVLQIRSALLSIKSPHQPRRLTESESNQLPAILASQKFNFKMATQLTRYASVLNVTPVRLVPMPVSVPLRASPSLAGCYNALAEPIYEVPFVR